MIGTARTGSLMAPLTLLLAGCGGLLGGGDHPATLYRFGNELASNGARPGGEPPGITGGQVRLVSFRGAVFPVESRGDRILTTRGSNVAYVADSRWIAPAPDLFDAALRREFSRSVPEVRFIGPAEGLRPDLILNVEVRRFEAVYTEGSAPVIAMEANVRLVRGADRTPIGEWTFASSKPATADKVTSLVSAYDDAAKEIIDSVEEVVKRYAGNGSIPPS